MPTETKEKTGSRIDIQTKESKDFGVSVKVGEKDGESTITIKIQGPKDKVDALSSSIQKAVDEAGGVVSDVSDLVDVLGEVSGKIASKGGEVLSRIGGQLVGFFSDARNAVDDAIAKREGKNDDKSSSTTY